jgi:serine/threonine protein kinase/Tol biopolymer transport system component
LNGITIASYRLLGPFGGGEGLYRAIRITDRRPALLLLAVSERPGDEPGSRLRRIALAASVLGHPAIANVQEVGQAGDSRLFVALEAIDGETLEGRLVRGPLPLDEAQDIALRLADGLARAHGESLVHGDLRPSCILLTPEGPRIAAFGLGELVASGPAAVEGATFYRAPERLRGAPPSPAADVWSLGVLLYEMLTGRPPFGGADEEERAAAVLEASPFPLPGVLRSIERVVLGALRKRPEERWADAAAMLDALRAVPQELGTGSELAPTVVAIPLQPGASGPHRAASGPHRAQAGQRTGPEGLSTRELPSYRLGAVLGSGGMAVIYRAEDLRLGRTVALKFLSPELSRDPGAKKQFLREARAASALDHPNVCTIHEVGETGDGQIYLAMPWYDGETVRHRIQRGMLDPAEAVEIAIQVAQGLAKAHRLGIVHRDIKPANLMITSDGVVKILDFGLAQLAGGTGAHTGEPRGGTVAYMSPEQAEGHGMDGRTDLWSLGVVLYEMLTGRKPFRGDLEQGIFYAILRSDPKPLAEVRSDLSPELGRIVARLLAKKREERHPDAESLLTDLRAVATEPRGVRSLPEPPRTAPSSRRRGLLAAVLLFLLIAGSAAFLFLSRGGEQGQGPVESDFTALTTEAGRETFPSVSPEGDFFVYAKTVNGDFDVFWQRAGGGNPRNLTSSPGADTQPALSPDGQSIAFRSSRAGGGLFVMGATGESVRRLTDFGFNPAWSPDGREIVFATEEVTGPGSRGSRSQLWIVDVVTGGIRRLETGPETGGDAVQPAWSPDGRRIAYWGVPAGTGRRAIWTISAIPTAGGEPILVVDGGGSALVWSPAWAPDGKHLYFAGDRGGAMGLWRVPIDQRSGRVRGEPRQVLAPATSSALPSLARDGRRIAFVSSEERANVVRIGFDPVRLETTGVLRPVTSGSRSVRSVHASPDGKMLVYATAAPQEDLFAVHSDGSGQLQLTDDPAKDRLPRWSADGERIVFYSDRGGEGYEAWARDARGPRLERLTDVSGAVVEPLESPDGSLLVCGIDFTGPRLIDLRKPLAERTPRGLQIDEAGAGEGPPAFGVTSWAPDGSRLAGFDEQGRIVVYSFASRRAEVLPETGTNATWLRDGRTLLFLRDDAVWAIDVPSRRARKLLDPPAHSAFSWIALSPDERTLYLVHATEEADIGMLTLK